MVVQALGDKIPWKSRSTNCMGMLLVVSKLGLFRLAAMDPILDQESMESAFPARSPVGNVEFTRVVANGLLTK